MVAVCHRGLACGHPRDAADLAQGEEVMPEVADSASGD